MAQQVYKVSFNIRYVDPNTQEMMHLRRDVQTNVIAESIPEAIQKVYIYIATQEAKRQQKILEQAKSDEEFIPIPNSIILDELNIKQEFLEVIQ